MPLSLPPVSYNHFRLTKKERWVARVDGEDGGPVLADLGEGVDEEDLNEARLAAATALRDGTPGEGTALGREIGTGEVGNQPLKAERKQASPTEVIFNDKILEAMTSNGKLKGMFVKILHSLPKVISNDKILKAMTSNGKLKDMFAKILHSLPANYGKEKHNNVENGKLRMFMWINYSQSGYIKQPWFYEGITLVGASREILIDVVWKKVIFNDKILEAMTSNGKLKDMFAKILHSLPANYGKYLEPLSLIMDQLSTMFYWAEGKGILLMRSVVDLVNALHVSRIVLLYVVWNPYVGR
uniref:Uncharacterized protein n=1 Tax=Oryza sativa subsp. japonica TaxID=39947 RepID=Q6YYJ0_ORYSJ|nr:hypothetical protein [Oryza sativa Japonica Group]